MTATTSTAEARVARNAVGLVFALNGLCFATWVSRIPEVRAELGLTNGQLGLLLLCLAAGSVLSLPTTGAFINRFGTATVVRAGASSAALGLVLAGLGAGAGLVPLTALGLFAYGVGTGTWDVSMNVEGAAVEHALGRTIMPRFHAGFSLGTVVGAGLGVLLVGLEVPMLAQLGVVGVGALLLVWVRAAAFLPALPVHEDRRPARSAWREPRTLMIGLMVLSLALTEGTANDWLALALVDGYDVPTWVGVAGFAVFVTAMTGGRLAGPVLLDRFGRPVVLWGTMVAGGLGVVLLVFGGPAGAVVGIVLWGVGASLGFPVGMSAAADDPARAAARVSVVSSIGYTAFLAGPPLIGLLAQRAGILSALFVVVGALVLGLLASGATRPLSPPG